MRTTSSSAASWKTDAERIMKALPQRFARVRPGDQRGEDQAGRLPSASLGLRPGRTHGPKPGTFSFLGFTHYWGKTWKGGYTIKRKTETKRMIRTRAYVLAMVSGQPASSAGGAVRDACVRNCVATTSTTACAATAVPGTGVLHGEAGVALLVEPSRRSEEADLGDVSSV